MTFAILGDSYSTFQGYVPEGYASWYSEAGNEAENNVGHVTDTWWYQLKEKTGMELIYNCSFSGTTVCHTGYDGQDYSEISFVTRMKRDLNESIQPDILLVFGGTNDFWAESPVGAPQYRGWTKEDCYQSAPAFCCMFDYLKKCHPKTRILNLLNDEITGTIRKRIVEICAHYEIPNLELENIKKENGHPNCLGMSRIAEQVMRWEAFSEKISHSI